MEKDEDGSRRNGSGEKRNPFRRVHELNKIGLKILTLGIPAEEFLGEIGLKHVMLYCIVHVTTTLFGVYELVASLLLSESLMELMTHWYVVLYSWCYAFHFMYLSGIFEEINQENFGNEHFYTTKMVPERAEEILNRNLDVFEKIFLLVLVIGGATTFTYVGGTIIDIVIELTTTGSVQQIFLLSYYTNVPLWGQAVVTFINLFTLLVVLTTAASAFIVTGIQTLKIKTQSEIIGEALTLANVDIRRCLQDHAELIRVTLMFSARKPGAMGLGRVFYFALAIQLLNLLESIGLSTYFSGWCDKDKSFAKSIMLMTQMAQRPPQQKLWLNALTIERATTLRIIQSSYSFYTILMIFQART